MPKTTTEYRYIGGDSSDFAFNCDIRADENSDAMVVRGTAIPFDSYSEPIWGSFYEVIRSQALTKTLAEFDQVALWQHDSSKPIGRRSRGTLKFEATERGLDFWLLLPENSFGRDAHEAIKRGDVAQMSFGFNVIEERLAGQYEGLPVREVLEMRLIEVSPVTFPAYKTTEVQARSILANNGFSLTPSRDEQPTTEPDLIHAAAGLKRDLARRRLELASI